MSDRNTQVASTAVAERQKKDRLTLRRAGKQVRMTCENVSAMMTMMAANTDQIAALNRQVLELQDQLAELRSQREEERWDALEMLVNDRMSRIERRMEDSIDRLFDRTNELIYDRRRIYQSPYSPSPDSE